MEWLGRATTNFHHAPKTVSLTLKDDPKATVSLPDFVKSVTPPCNLNPALPGGHFQTIYTVLTKEDVPIDYRRHVFESDHPDYGGSFTLDFVVHLPAEEKGAKDEGLPPRTKHYTEAEWAPIEAGSDDSKPMVLALHGLSGGSYEQYLKETIEPLAYGKGGPQFEVIVINSRGCARSKVTTPRLFNARSTWDLRQTVKWIQERYPNRPLFGIGFSLGANILVNYLGEEGESCVLKAAVACSSPWDLAVGSLSLQRSWIGREVYSKTMATNLKKLFTRHMDALKVHPKLDVDRIMGVTYLHEFDRETQCHIWNYPTEGAYYRDASSTDPMMAARVPILAINAEDDPVAPPETLPYQEIKQNPYALMVTTSMGGHLSWFEVGGKRWFVKPAAGFLQKMAAEVNLKVRPILPQGGDPEVDLELPTYDPIRRKLHRD